MFKKICAGILCLLFVTPSLAQTGTESDDTAAVNESGANSKRSSRDNRSQKKFVVTGQPAGIMPGGVFAIGASFGWYLDPDSIVQLEATSGKSSFLWIFWPRVRASTLGLSYKKFVGETFYLAGGAMYKSVEYDDWQIFSDDGSFKGYAILANFGLGNQWQWRGFTLGCDWIGLAVPLTSKVTESNVDGLSEYDLDDLERHQQRQLKDVQGYAVRLYLGASF